MKNSFKLFVTLFLLVFAMSKSFAVVPTYNMTIKNIITQPNLANGADSLIFFDVYILWTNPASSDVFEFASSQMAINYNPAITAGTLAVTKVGLGPAPDFPVGQQNPTVIIGGGLFQASANLPVSTNNFYISSVFPGNRMLRVKIRTTAHIWNTVAPNFQFKLGAAPNTFAAYFNRPVDPADSENQLITALMDTVANHYSTESNNPLPVELASFTSTVNRNNVALAWATSRETNNQGFDIERTPVGTTTWTKAGYIAGHGTTNETETYSFNERINTGHYSYRLKQIDFNGNNQYFPLSNEVEVGIPTTYAVSQNYPNPFNPSTKIDFELPYDGKVSILLYDISGREVGKLVNEVKTAGYYTVQFNASNLASGMYFYRITAQGSNQNFVQTKKMVLIK